MTHASTDLTGLDFDTYVASLRRYMRAQPTFRDYNFESSALTELLNVLALNTFNTAFYLNMLFAETGLSSARLRDSVVSRAKELNYVPRSVRSASATVAVTFRAAPGTVTIPREAAWSSRIGDSLYTFVSVDDHAVYSANGTYSHELDIYEGHYVSDRYVVDLSDAKQRFTVTDANVDTRSVSVTVTEDTDANELEYTVASSLLGVGATDRRFWLQAAEGGRFEVLFGDGVIGRRPKDGAVIEVRYRVSRGTDGNGASRFTLDTQFADFVGTPTTETVSSAAGGAAAESIESIKFYAPRHFQIQERALVASDYEIMLKQRFQEINAVSAYGGEELEPPRHGRVYVAVDLTGIDGLPRVKADEFYSFLKPRMPLSIEPVFVEPDYLYYRPETIVRYDVNATNMTAMQVEAMVSDGIVAFNEANLDDFKSTFRSSKFVAAIDALDDAILGNDTEVRIYKRIVPTIGTDDYSIDFGVPIEDELAPISSLASYDSAVEMPVYSSTFVSDGIEVRIHDDGEGRLRLVQATADGWTVVKTVGTIDYAAGAVSLVDLTIDSYDGDAIRLYAEPKSGDFSSTRNTILTLEPSEVSVAVEPVRSGESVQSYQRG